METSMDKKDYLHWQNESMKSIVNMVEQLYDGWFIREDTFAWDAINKCWVIRIYPEDEQTQWDIHNQPI